ncbi:MAG: hypothetical protein K6F09_03445 [Clostridiales bacterium]|nr:hypothetical protein [Clostridiales bacterium]
MKIIRLAGRREVHIHADRFSVYSGKLRLFCFDVSSMINTADEKDCDTSLTFLDSHDDTRFVWEATSTLWEKKQYILKFSAGCFSFRVRVWGKGQPYNIEYFRKTSDGLGSPFAVSGYSKPSCQSVDRARTMHLISDEPAVIFPERAAPPPFVFPFWNDVNDDWIGVGLAAKKDEHNFMRFELHAPKNDWDENGIWFSVPLSGYPAVEDGWRSPTIWCGFGRDDLDVIRAWAQWQYNVYGFEKNIPETKAPLWWKMPIFCGWGMQVKSRKASGNETNSYATENDYNKYLSKLESLGSNIGTVIIDDKWQSEYGTNVPDKEKWNDMRAFVDAQHEKGRHVLLWIKCWESEGLPEEECIKCGDKYYADPTDPAYLERLKKMIHDLLSSDEGCCDVDGFKLDFFDRIPSDAGYESKEPLYGLELMKRLIENIYRFSKEAKSDALINASCLHPYFSSCCDQFRAHDIDANVRSTGAIVSYRSDLAKSVMPGILVDTDGATGYTKEEKLNALRKRFSVGIPTLYDFPDEFGKDEWDEVNLMLNAYVESLK